MSLRILGFVFSTVLSVNPDEMTTRFLDPSSKSVMNWQRLQARKVKRRNSPA